MAFELNQQDLMALALGGCFFGSGGGGTLKSAQQMAASLGAGPESRTAASKTFSVKVVSVEEATEGCAAMVAYVGSPEAANAGTNIDAPTEAVRMMMERLEKQGKKLSYLVSPESGAVGPVLTCLVAARLGLKVIDGDGAGRAVPELSMLTYAAHHVDPRPLFLVSDKGLKVELDVTPRAGEAGDKQHQADVSVIIDKMLRPIVAEEDFGNFGSVAMWVMEGKEIQRAMPIRKTFSRAVKTGYALQNKEIKTHQDMIGFLANNFDIHARVIFKPGTLKSSSLSEEDGFDKGDVIIEADGQECHVKSLNESLLVYCDPNVPLAMGPDSIAYFLPDSTEKLYSNGDLCTAQGPLYPEFVGQRVVLIGLPADKALLIKNGLIADSFAVTLKELGYAGPYVPLGSSSISK